MIGPLVAFQRRLQVALLLRSPPDAAGSSAPPQAHRAAPRCSWSRSTHRPATLYFSARIVLRAQHLVQDRPGAEQLHRRLAAGAGLQLVHARAECPPPRPPASPASRSPRCTSSCSRRRPRPSSYMRRMPSCTTTASSYTNAGSYVTHVGTVLASTMRVAILVLQSFAQHRRAPGRPAHQEALAARVRKRPRHVPDALKSEHRVVHVEGNRRHACSSSRPCPPP